MSTWQNNDGLFVKFGTREATPSKVGDVKTFGPLQTLELTLTMTELTDTNAIISDAAKLPKNVLIQSIELLPTVAITSGGSAVLDIGLIDNDRSSNHDDDALIAAHAIASHNAVGEWTNIILGGTGAGVQFGVVTTKNTYITAGFDTAAYTAGKLKIRINYLFTA
jgi:hypothetical protein